MKNILETITRVGILEQNSTNVGCSRFMTVSRVNRGWCEEKSCHGTYIKIKKCMLNCRQFPDISRNFAFMCQVDF